MGYTRNRIKTILQALSVQVLFCHPVFLVFKHCGVLESGTKEGGSFHSLHTLRGCLSVDFPVLLPCMLGTREETELVGAEVAKEFPNRKTSSCEPQDKAGVPKQPGPRVTDCAASQV